MFLRIDLFMTISIQVIMKNFAWNFWRNDYLHQRACDGFLFWQQTAMFLRIDLFMTISIQVIMKNFVKTTCLMY